MERCVCLCEKRVVVIGKKHTRSHTGTCESIILESTQQHSVSRNAKTSTPSDTMIRIGGQHEGAQQQQQQQQHDDDSSIPLSTDEECAALEITSQQLRGQGSISNSRSSSRTVQFATVPTIQQQQQLDEREYQRPPRLSTLRRESFVMQFFDTRGPPQIALLMFLIAMAVGSTIGVVPAVMTDRFARLNHGYPMDAPDCSTYTSIIAGDVDTATSSQQQQHIKPEACLLGSADAQTAVSTANLISNVLTFATSSLMGSLSDEYGRRGTYSYAEVEFVFVVVFVMKYTLLSHTRPNIHATGILILGFALGTIPPFLLFITQLIPSMSPWWYYTAHGSTGLVNGVAIALSCLADVLPQQYRAPGIGLLLAGFMLGFSLSPILSLMLPRIHLSFVSFLMVLTGWLCTVFVVPETLPPSIASEARRLKRIEMERNSTKSIGWRIQQTLTRPLREMSILNRNQFFRLISSLAFFSGMVSSGDQVLLIYYLEERLAFTNADVSVMFMIMGIMGLVAQAVILKPLNDCIGEKMVVAFAFLCGAIDNAMYGLARHKYTIFGAVAISGLTGMAFPTISAIKANNVDVTEQGRIQGALYSLQALASGIGPVVLRYVYGKTKDSVLGPGSMFLFASCLYLVAVGIALALPKDKANASRPSSSSVSDVDYGVDDEQQHQRHQHGTEYALLTSDTDSFSDEDDVSNNYGTMAATTTTTAS